MLRVNQPAIQVLIDGEWQFLFCRALNSAPSLVTTKDRRKALDASLHLKWFQENYGNDQFRSQLARRTSRWNVNMGRWASKGIKPKADGWIYTCDYDGDFCDGDIEAYVRKSLNLPAGTPVEDTGRRALDTDGLDLGKLWRAKPSKD